MTYTVKYRDKSGDIVELELDVPNKNAVWPELKKRGISALSVREGAAKKRASKMSGGKSPSPLRGVLAGLCVVALAAFAAWWFLLKDGKPTPKTEDEPKPKRVKEIKPEKPKTVNPSSNTNKTEVAKPNEKMHFGVPHSEWVKLSHEEKVALGQAAYDAEAAKIDSTYLERKKAHYAEIAARPFKHTSENVISSIFSLNYGDHVLMGDFHPTLQDDFLKSLNDPIVINDDDSEEVKRQKEEMIILKPKIKQLIDQGYTLKEILDDYRNSIAKVQELEFNLRKELDEIKRTSTSVEEVRDFIEAANKMMLDAGAKNFTYHLSEGAIRKILINAERAQQGEKK